MKYMLNIRIYSISIIDNGKSCDNSSSIKLFSIKKWKPFDDPSMVYLIQKGVTRLWEVARILNHALAKCTSPRSIYMIWKTPLIYVCIYVIPKKEKDHEKS